MLILANIFTQTFKKGPKLGVFLRRCNTLKNATIWARSRHYGNYYLTLTFVNWYPHKDIEAKWQRNWEQHPNTPDSTKPKQYVLFEFPYPSGDGLHVGHVRPYTAMDAVARKKRMEGYNVLFPVGWDAFGLPTENYAIKHKIHPRVATDKNIATFKRQMKSLGLSVDWSREIDTTDPNYYKWTQWIFLQLLKHGLAYQATIPINWCPKDKIGLANEEVVGGKCERCGTQVTRKMQRQWMLKITAYAERLLADLETVDYLPEIKTQQQNWIGKSEGAEIQFKVKSEKLKSEEKITIFTTRPDTIFGATYVVVAPEHPLIQNIKLQITNLKEIENSIEQAAKKSDLDRTDLAKEKTGVELKGVKAINPANGEEIPIWVADYVLGSYGTGAIMAVPAHDERDYEFAKQFGLPIRNVIEPKYVNESDESAVHSDEEFVKREAVCAIVRNPKNNTYLCIEWKTARMHGLVTGGIEEGEDIIECAKREVFEETGYRNLRFVHEHPVALHSLFYHRVKRQNRWARFRYVFFDLENEEREAVDESEAALHEVVWKTADEMPGFFTVIEGEYLHQIISNPEYVYTGHGILRDSGVFSGTESTEAIQAITHWLEKRGQGKAAMQYKLRDWVFSRQHYWGEPIPVVHCEKDGVVPIPEDQLPLELPHVAQYEPTDTGESPLALIETWVNTKCPRCGGPAKRETDTMPNWAGSSWYFLRFCDPDNDKAFADFKKLKYWMPVDIYNGGMEHTVLHLLYSRFWHKFLFDQGVVPTAEPYAKRHSHGLVLAEDNQKMSKSRGNVINPDDVIKEYGADSLRMYEMFMGPFEDAIPWSTRGIVGVHRFLQAVYDLFQEQNATEKASAEADAKQLEQMMHQTIKKVTEDIDGFRFNTAVSTLMQFVNALKKLPAASDDLKKTLLLLLFPMAPHLSSELWEQAFGGDIANESWPKFDAAKVESDTVTIVVQVNGKVRGKIVMPRGASEAEVLAAAKADPNVLKYKVQEAKKVITVQDRMVNFVV